MLHNNVFTTNLCLQILPYFIADISYKYLHSVSPCQKLNTLDVECTLTKPFMFTHLFSPLFSHTLVSVHSII